MILSAAPTPYIVRPISMAVKDMVPQETAKRECPQKEQSRETIMDREMPYFRIKWELNGAERIEPKMAIEDRMEC